MAAVAMFRMLSMELRASGAALLGDEEITRAGDRLVSPEDGVAPIGLVFARTGLARNRPRSAAEVSTLTSSSERTLILPVALNSWVKQGRGDHEPVAVEKVGLAGVAQASIFQEDAQRWSTGCRRWRTPTTLSLAMMGAATIKTNLPLVALGD